MIVYAKAQGGCGGQGNQLNLNIKTESVAKDINV
jgi:hypothetical protein